MSFSLLNLIMQPSEGYEGMETKNKDKRGRWGGEGKEVMERWGEGWEGDGMCIDRGCFPRQCWLWQPWSFTTQMSLQERSRVKKMDATHHIFCTNAKATPPQCSPSQWLSTARALLELAIPARPGTLLMGDWCLRTPHWPSWDLRSALKSEAVPTSPSSCLLLIPRCHT